MHLLPEDFNALGRQAALEHQASSMSSRPQALLCPILGADYTSHYLQKKRLAHRASLFA